MGSTPPPGLLHPQQWSWAQRLLLAEITGDTDAAELVADEIGDCVGCWRIVAGHATRLAANGWFHVSDEDALIDLLCNGISYTLDRLDQESGDTP